MPLEIISVASAQEPSAALGHPSTLHTWWARRPLAACRCILFAQLVDDPSADPLRFPTEEAQRTERQRLFAMIGRLASLDSAYDPAVLDEARQEIWDACGGTPPTIHDPFAGGGSIPLEAQRFGLTTYASDLNPVAVIINKALIEIPPKFSGLEPAFPGAAEARSSWRNLDGLAEDVLRYGLWVRDEAQKALDHLYPKVQLEDGTLVAAVSWIWARTVRCSDSACAGVTPLVRSFWLRKTPGDERWIDPVSAGNHIRFEIKGPGGSPRGGTVNRSGATCLLCARHMSLAYVRAEDRGGRVGTQLMAIAADDERRRRCYLPAVATHEAAALVGRPDDVPKAELPQASRYLNRLNDASKTWADLFTDRQLVMLCKFTDLARATYDRVLADGEDASYAQAIATYIGLVCSQMVERNTALGGWDARTAKEEAHGIFSWQAATVAWDFAETNPLGGPSGSFIEGLQWVSNAVAALPGGALGVAVQADAARSHFDNAVICTDPPYYDISYSDLTDLFYIWMRRALMYAHPDVTVAQLSPKAGELMADPVRHGGVIPARQFFENRLEEWFGHLCEVSPEGFPICLFTAYRRTGDGRASAEWEALLESMLRSGLAITGIWPMRTHLANGPRDLDSIGPASSVVVACRPQPEGAPVTDRRSFVAELREKLAGSMAWFEEARISPADLPQALLGPGLAAFTTYRQVIDVGGASLGVAAVLRLVDETVDEIRMVLSAGLSPDSRWCLEWFRAHGFEAGDRAEAYAKGAELGLDVTRLEDAGVVQTARGRAWLTPPADLDGDYDPRSDDCPSEWKVLLLLAMRFHKCGTEPTAPLMAAAGSVIDLGAVRQLAYSVFPVAETSSRGLASLLNDLAKAWPDIVDLSAA